MHTTSNLQQPSRSRGERRALPKLSAAVSPSRFLRYYMRHSWQSVLLASCCSLLLGLLASFLGALIGPSLQLLLEGQAAQGMTLSQLLGARLGPILERWSGLRSLDRQQLFFYLPFLLLSVAAVKAFFLTLQSFLWERLGERLSLQMREDLMSAYVASDPLARKRAEGREKEAALSACLSTDVKLMREYVVHFYGGLPREAFQLVFLALVLAGLSPKLFLVFFLGVLPVVALLQRLGRKLRRRASRALDDYSQLTEWLQQRLLGIETIKHYRSENREIAKLRQLTQGLFLTFLKAARVKARTAPLVEVFAIFAMVGVLVIALQDIHKGVLTGALATSFFASLAMLAQSAAMIGRYLNSNREGAAAVMRILEMQRYLQGQEKNQLCLGQSHFTEPPRSNPSAILSCVAITVSYPEAPVPALQGFSYSFDKGQIYCIAGPSGAGKSTLFKTLLQQLPLSAGELRFHVAAKPSGSVVGYMPQQVVLMSASLAANIYYPAQQGDPQAAWRALRAVQLESFVQGLPEQLATPVGAQGLGLSGGQAQRLLLARLYYHEYPLILFDEGTSALDPEVEQVVYAGLKKLSAAGACILMIAHRRSALELADVTLQIEGGRLLGGSSVSDSLASDEPLRGR